MRPVLRPPVPCSGVAELPCEALAGAAAAAPAGVKFSPYQGRNTETPAAPPRAQTQAAHNVSDRFAMARQHRRKRRRSLNARAFMRPISRSRSHRARLACQASPRRLASASSASGITLRSVRRLARSARPSAGGGRSPRAPRAWRAASPRSYTNPLTVLSISCVRKNCSRSRCGALRAPARGPRLGRASSRRSRPRRARRAASPGARACRPSTRRRPASIAARPPLAAGADAQRVALPAQLARRARVHCSRRPTSSIRATAAHLRRRPRCSRWH